MRKLLWFVIGFFTAVVLFFVVSAAFIQAGGMSMSAIEGPRGPEGLVGPWLYDRWVSTHAEDTQNPSADEAAQAAGREHYCESCVLCHGAPSVEPREFSRGLDPPAPELWGDTQEMTDGQLYLVVHDGVRMTGMPAFGTTHTDQQIWQIVAFLRHLPKITPDERKALEAAVGKLSH